MTDGKEPIRMSAEDARTLATEPGFEQWDCGGVSMYLDATNTPRMGPITSARGPRAPRERLEPIPDSGELQLVGIDADGGLIDASDSLERLRACSRAIERRGLAGLGFGLAASHGAPAASWSSSP